MTTILLVNHSLADCPTACIILYALSYKLYKLLRLSEDVVCTSYNKRPLHYFFRFLRPALSPMSDNSGTPSHRGHLPSGFTGFQNCTPYTSDVKD